MTAAFDMSDPFQVPVQQLRHLNEEVYRVLPMHTRPFEQSNCGFLFTFHSLNSSSAPDFLWQES